VALEDIEDYQALEAAIIADYDARAAVERELVLAPAAADTGTVSGHRSCVAQDGRKVINLAQAAVASIR
jgi:hypothetical protein